MLVFFPFTFAFMIYSLLHIFLGHYINICIALPLLRLFIHIITKYPIEPSSLRITQYWSGYSLSKYIFTSKYSHTFMSYKELSITNTFLTLTYLYLRLKQWFGYLRPSTEGAVLCPLASAYPSALALA